MNAVPKAAGGESLGESERMFEPHDPGSRWSRLRSQLADLSSGYREGGFFIVIGRRRVQAHSLPKAPDDRETFAEWETSDVRKRA